MNKTTKSQERISAGRNNNAYLSLEEEQAMECPHFKRPSHYVCDGCGLSQTCSDLYSLSEYV